jgi:hypothetical protein
MKRRPAQIGHYNREPARRFKITMLFFSLFNEALITASDNQGAC